MPPFIRIIVWLALGLLLPNISSAKSPVWKISSGSEVLYLAGTIHVLSLSDYPLPPAFDRAYQNSETVIFETDIQKLQQIDFQQKMLPRLKYEQDNSIRQVLDKDTYQQLVTHFADNGISLEPLSNFKPGMLAITLTMIELQKLGMASTGVDFFYSNLALQDSKPQGMLETASSQIEIIAAMGEGRESEFIQHTLHDLDSLPKLMQDMKTAWREGDTVSLETLTLKPFSEEFPAIYKSLIVDRNVAWLSQFIEMLASEETEMVMVGAAHLVGDEGLLSQLKELGYTVEQL